MYERRIKQMTFKDIAKKLTTSIQTLPEIVRILAEGLENVEDSSTGAFDFTTEEQEIGTWNEKKLYRKVVTSTTAPTADTWSTVALPANISVKMYEAYYVRSTGVIDKFSSYRGDTSPAEALLCSVNNSNAEYRVSTQFITNFSEFRIIIYYTKE